MAPKNIGHAIHLSNMIMKRTDIAKNMGNIAGLPSMNTGIRNNSGYDTLAVDLSVSVFGTLLAFPLPECRSRRRLRDRTQREPCRFRNIARGVK
jgi:hypothetical protein